MKTAFIVLTYNRVDALLAVLRGLAPVVEPLMQLWRQVRGAWRERLWGLPTTAPRIWAM